MVNNVQAQAEQGGKSPTLKNPGLLAFQGIATLLFQDLNSESSRRVYRNTFQQWELFAVHNNLDVMDLSCDNVKSFIYSRELSHNTRLSRKSHMQRLLRIVSYLDASFGIHYIQLRDLKIRRTSSDKSPRRKPRVLSHEECRQLLTVWKSDESHKGIRNHAVICLLLYSTIRTTELVALRWEDINWDTQTLTIYRGNERMRFSMPILDASPNTLNALRRLQDTQKSVFADRDIPCKHVLPALSTGKGARFKPDKDVRTSSQTIRNIVKQTGGKAGLGTLTVFDLHYTSATMFAKADATEATMPRSPIA